MPTRIPSSRYQMSSSSLSSRRRSITGCNGGLYEKIPACSHPQEGCWHFGSKLWRQEKRKDNGRTADSILVWSTVSNAFRMSNCNRTSCCCFGCVGNLDANLLRTQMSGYSGNNRVHEQVTSQTAKCVAHCVWAKTTRRLAKWHKTRGCEERYAFAGERADCNSCAKCRKGNQELFAFRFQQHLQVRAAPPRRSSAGAWGKLFQLGFDGGRRKLRLSWKYSTC